MKLKTPLCLTCDQLMVVLEEPRAMTVDESTALGRRHFAPPLVARARCETCNRDGFAWEPET